MNSPNAMSDALELIHRGKVREMYAVDDRHLLMVATDAISAFDVVFDQIVPDKGKVLTAMTVWWGEFLMPQARTHLVAGGTPAIVSPSAMPAIVSPSAMPAIVSPSATPTVVSPSATPTPPMRPEWAGRALLVRRARMLPIECIVRGYITGSAWSEYEADGTMHGTKLPAGLLEAEKLPEPVFTPSTKADSGHDINISFEQSVELVGRELAEQARELCLRVYTTAAEHTAGRGVIIADTKFELGIVDDELVIADEILTPDSSRFWQVADWKPGTTPPSLDKQPVRDVTAATGWNKRPPAPPLTDTVVAATRDRYIKAYEVITGNSFNDWLAATTVTPTPMSQK